MTPSRITFICSSLEPGRDGVGDYTRVLAAALAKRGHGVEAVALHDRHITSPLESTHESGGRILRLPAATPWADRVARARGFVDRHQPDWISVQFVAYGFQNRGHVWGLGPRLRAVAGRRPIHLMFHELWAGARGSPLRERLEGWLQKQATVRMVRELAPAAVHTHAPPYVVMLRNEGIATGRLPLFGNIVPDTTGNTDWLKGEFTRAGIDLANDRDRQMIFGLFGALHREWRSEPLVPRIIDAARQRAKIPVFVAIGRLGAGERVWANLKQKYETTIRFIHLGELPADRVSHALLTLDFVIATSPLALIGKSSTAATAIDHGLPLIVSRNDISYPFEFQRLEKSEALIIPLGDDFAQRLATARRRPAVHTVDRVAADLSRALEGESAILLK